MAALSAQDAIRLRAEIGAELQALGQVATEVASRADARDDTTTYALGLLLMNYDTGAERIFRRIAAQLGGVPPANDRWHIQLLEDMALDLPLIRPPVVRPTTVEGLGRFLRLRHVLRNLYAWSIRRSELDTHVASLRDIHEALSDDLASFDQFLEALAKV